MKLVKTNGLFVLYFYIYIEYYASLTNIRTSTCQHYQLTIGGGG